MVALIDGFSLRNALELMDALRFRSQKEKHELSHIYEAKVKTWAIRAGTAGNAGGETKIGERNYDGALGSAGFSCEAYDYLRHGDVTTSQLQTLRLEAASACFGLLC
jgi:type I restriction enzyme M protein